MAQTDPGDQRAGIATRLRFREPPTSARETAGERTVSQAEGRRERLRDTLEELEAELHASGPLDPELRERLERAIGEARKALARAEHEHPGPDEHHSLVDHLTDNMRRFEAEHPKLSLAVGRVVDALSNLGI